MTSNTGGKVPVTSIENLSSEEITARTYRWDRLRGAGQGTAETCWTVFALLIAIRVFSADESIKQFIPMGMGLGFLFSPIGLSLANRLNQPVSRILSLIWLVVALFLAGMTFAKSIIPYVLCVCWQHYQIQFPDVKAIGIEPGLQPTGSCLIVLAEWQSLV